MNLTMLPPAELNALVNFFASVLDTGSKPAIPPDRREEFVHLLMSALIGPVARDEYCSALEGALSRLGVDRPADISLAELPVDDLLRDGLGVLTDDQLFRLATSHSAVGSLNGRVWVAMANGTIGDRWEEVGDSIADNLPPTYLGPDAIRRVNNHIKDLERHEPDESPVTDISFRPKEQPSSQHRLAHWLWPSLALVASILFAFFLGTRMHPAGSFSANRPMEVLAASVTTQFDPGRGTGNGLRIRVQAGRRGFATVISLATARSQEVFPEPGSADIHLDETMASINVPIPSDSKSAIVVITETQSTGHIRKALTGKNYMANDAIQLQRDLCKALSEQGYTWASVGISQIDQPTKP